MQNQPEEAFVLSVSINKRYLEFLDNETTKAELYEIFDIQKHYGKPSELTLTRIKKLFDKFTSYNTVLNRVSEN